MAAQLAVFLGMQLAADQPVRRPQQRPDQRRRAGIQPDPVDQRDIGRQRQRRAVEQPPDARPPLPGAPGGPAVQVVAAGAGMRVQDGDRRVLALQGADQPNQQRVLHAVGEIPGVVGMAVVHVLTLPCPGPAAGYPTPPLIVSTVPEV